MDLTPAQLSSKRLLIVIATITILILFILYAIFWLNFFGVYKLPLNLPTTKQQPYQEQQKKIDALIKGVKTIINKPLDPAITQDAWGMRIGGIEDYLNQAEETLAKGEIEKTRELLKRVDNLIFIMGATKESQPLSDGLKKQHDPKNKYIKTNSIDPRVKDIYLQVIDLMVETDRNY